MVLDILSTDRRSVCPFCPCVHTSILSSVQFCPYKARRLRTDEVRYLILSVFHKP